MCSAYPYLPSSTTVCNHLFIHCFVYDLSLCTLFSIRYISEYWNSKRCFGDTTLPRNDISTHHTIVLTLQRKVIFFILYSINWSLKLWESFLYPHVSRLNKLISINKEKMFCFHIIISIYMNKKVTNIIGLVHKK